MMVSSEQRGVVYPKSTCMSKVGGSLWKRTETHHPNASTFVHLRSQTLTKNCISLNAGNCVKISSSV